MAKMNKFHVVIERCDGYRTVDSRCIDTLFLSAGVKIPSNSFVLVKPNLISPAPLFAVTHPAVTVAVCRLLLDHGNRVICGDSPAFGHPASVASAIGLDIMLKKLGLKVEELDRPVRVTLQCGAKTAISAKALDADCIINLPKMKAHCQMGLTGAVKNMFGTVCGFRKAIAHCKYGDEGNMFPAMLLDISSLLAPLFNILDAVTAMHVTGPVKGEPFEAGILVASAYPVALDTSLYDILAVSPEGQGMPLWNEARRRDMPQAFRRNIVYSRIRPELIDMSGFALPDILQPETFHPFKLLKGRCKSAAMRMKFLVDGI